MGHTPAKPDSQAVTANDPVTQPGSPDPAEPAQTNATWKPTAIR
jgi:hypothetical protein